VERIAMTRPVWKGHISFGLVNVPVILYPAEQRQDIGFHLIDSRNSARVRYERINEETGEEVPWDKIVKGYEYDDHNYVLLSEDELERASAELTRTIEIEKFIDLARSSSSLTWRISICASSTGRTCWFRIRKATRDTCCCGKRLQLPARRALQRW
jgi:Ku protein